MKKVLLALTAFSLTFGACQKNTSTLPPVTDTVYIDSNAGKEVIDTSVTISGIKDIRTTPWSSMFSLPITVTRNSGLEQKVSMSVTGVPANVKAEWTAMSGFTTFATSLDIETRFVKPGNYPLVISSTTEKGKTRDFTVNMVVDTVTTKECNTMLYSKILGAITIKDTTLDSNVYVNTAMSNNFNESQLYLRNLMMHYEDGNSSKTFISYNQTSGTFHVKLNFNCEDGSITIPEQELQGRSFSGNNYRTFTVSGSGNVDLETGTYEFTYTTSYDDGGTIVTSYYIASGNLNI